MGWGVNLAGRVSGPIGTGVLESGRVKLGRRGQDYALECGALAKRKKEAVWTLLPRLQKPLQRPCGTSLFGPGTMHETDCFGW